MLDITRAVNGYPFLSYYPGSKIANGYLRNKGEQEKLTEGEQEDQMRGERLPGLVKRF